MDDDSLRLLSVGVRESAVASTRDAVRPLLAASSRRRRAARYSTRRWRPGACTARQQVVWAAVATVCVGVAVLLARYVPAHALSQGAAVSAAAVGDGAAPEGAVGASAVLASGGRGGGDGLPGENAAQALQSSAAPRGPASRPPPPPPPPPAVSPTSIGMHCATTGVNAYAPPCFSHVEAAPGATPAALPTGTACVVDAALGAGVLVDAGVARCAAAAPPLGGSTAAAVGSRNSSPPGGARAASTGSAGASGRSPSGALPGWGGVRGFS